jgi:hypothetical protein
VNRTWTLRTFLPVAVAAAGLTIPPVAHAADYWERRPYRAFPTEVEESPPKPGVIERSKVVTREVCKVIERRRFDEFGDPVVRRIRICEETAAPRPHTTGYGPPVRSPYAYGAPRTLALRLGLWPSCAAPPGAHRATREATGGTRRGRLGLSPVPSLGWLELRLA